MNSVIAVSKGKGDDREMAEHWQLFGFLALPRQTATAGTGTRNYVVDEMKNPMTDLLLRRANSISLAAHFRPQPGGGQLPDRLP